MTNAEKYLKDGVDIEELTDKFEDWHKTHSNVVSYGKALFRFLQAEVKPTLSEDEKVILKKLRYEKGAYEFMKIGRTELDSEGGCDLILIEVDNDTTWFGEYGHLFQFIKPRRRI